MADHLKIDFEALAIDVHLIEGTQTGGELATSGTGRVSRPYFPYASRSKSSHSDAGTTHRSLISTGGSLIRERI